MNDATTQLAELDDFELIAERTRLAVETLLADPEALGDDVLETCLYLLRERLREPGGRH